MKIGTWNIRSMLRAEKLENVKREMKKNKLNILGLTEVRWKESGDIVSDKYRVIYSGGQQSQRGVCVILDETTSRCVNQVKYISDRLMMVRLNGEPVDIVIILVYMPTSDYEDEDVEEVYEQIEDLMRNGRGDDYVVVLGDLNASIGNKAENGVTGKYGLGQRNHRGQMLFEFCSRNSLCVTNTMYRHSERRIYTWKAPGDIRRLQLDYIIVKQRYRNSVKNSHAFPGADANSDHNLVAMKARLNFKRIKKPMHRKRWNLSVLKGTGKEILNQEIQRRLQDIEFSGADVEEDWSTLKRSIIDSAEESIGRTVRRKAKKPWVTEEMLEKMEERRKWKRINSNEGKRMYRKLNNELRRATDQAREKFWEDECKELEDLEKRGKMDQLYGKVKELTWKKNSVQKTTNILSKQGELLTDGEEIKTRWVEYIEELYNKAEKPNDIPLELEHGVDCDRKGPPLLDSEIDQAIDDLKSGKSEGEDGVPAEILKALSADVKHILANICKAIYNTGKWPEDFKISSIITLQKKPNAQKCEDHRTISILSHASKIMLKILNNRIRTKTSEYIGNDQFGFRKGMGTREAIAVMRALGERSMEHNQEVYVCFVDYEKAFDRVDWTKLMAILKKLDVDWRDRRLITNLYMGQTATVRTEEGMTTACIIGRGVRQGCLLSPLLFNIYAQAMMDEAMDEVFDGVKVGGHLIQAVRFADDQAMTASSAEGLQSIMTKLNEVVERYKMRINIKKTKVMKIGRNQGDDLHISINGIELEQVSQFKYLGSILTENGSCESEIRVRIALAKDAFSKHQTLLTKNIRPALKKRLVKTLIWSVLLYGAETWTMKKADIKKLEGCEMWFWRRMEKISWTEHVTNEEVLRRVGEKRTMVDTVWKRKARWTGHVLRSEGMLRTVLEGRMEGKRGRGRKRLMMLDDVLMKRPYQSMKRLTEDRQTWRRLSYAGPARGQTT